MDQQREWMRTPEAAKYLGVHVETMRRWAREGTIPAAKLGNRGGFRFKREDLDRFLQTRTRFEHEGDVDHDHDSPIQRS
jgi:excisionase family DNA binding protein